MGGACFKWEGPASIRTQWDYDWQGDSWGERGSDVDNAVLAAGVCSSEWVLVQVFVLEVFFLCKMRFLRTSRTFSKSYAYLSMIWRVHQKQYQDSVQGSVSVHVQVLWFTAAFTGSPSQNKDATVRLCIYTRQTGKIRLRRNKTML